MDRNKTTRDFYITQVSLQENTLVNERGRAVLCDFGLARILDDEHTGLTTTDTTKYTTRYASPELVMREGAVHSLRSDMWAWGCLLLDVRLSLPYCRRPHQLAPSDND